jgi:N-acetylmuramoyl-L-alanine amidase
MFRAGKYGVVLLLCFCGFGVPGVALGQSQILNIRHWVAPDHTRIVIDLSDDAAFTVDRKEGVVAVDLASVTVAAHLPEAMVLKKPGVEKISLFVHPPAVRVELALPGPVQANVFKLKKFQDKPYRIVIDLILQDAAKKESEAREKMKVARKARVVVIDPGHGGDAPGAVGKRGTFEKNVVLAIAKKVRDMINGREGYHSFLTRNDDYYVSFNKRLTMARECGADLFVSIHADAAANRQASGSSVYCLSNGGASSEAARILARNENLADIVGGVPSSEGNDASDPIILDMFQTHNINQSRIFGSLLLKELGSATRLKFATVQEAPFRVLKLPEIPSVLVETAYISNAQEEKLLQSDRFQSRIAEGVTRSVVAFLSANPVQAPPVTVPLNDPEPKPQSAAIQKEAKKTPPPQVPRMSPAVKPPPAKPAATYQVKRGDSLGKIAARYGTTVPVLMELNRLKRAHPLYIGLKLVLPEKP